MSQVVTDELLSSVGFFCLFMICFDFACGSFGPLYFKLSAFLFNEYNFCNAIEFR